MVAGSGSGGVDRIGGSGAEHLIRLARRITAQGRPGGWDDRVRRDEILRLWCEEKVREWTNQRFRAQLRAGRPPGPESSIGKVHQGMLNQQIQLVASALLGPGATAWPQSGPEWSKSVPYEVKGMLRSRANTIEGGTTEVNKNILGERVLGLPREPDPWTGVAWREVPRS
jgi:alkylation response protein AidB-like acyl-CoA dehydrogenase